MGLGWFSTRGKDSLSGALWQCASLTFFYQLSSRLKWENMRYKDTLSVFISSWTCAFCRGHVSTQQSRANFLYVLLQDDTDFWDVDNWSHADSIPFFNLGLHDFQIPKRILSLQYFFFSTRVCESCASFILVRFSISAGESLHTCRIPDALLNPWNPNCILECNKHQTFRIKEITTVLNWFWQLS